MGRSKCGLPHARGGVSSRKSDLDAAIMSSPRPWGCFSPWRKHGKDHHVFPTPVGVFLYSGVISTHRLRLPHARGGVSQSQSTFKRDLGSSPRPWGCFCCDPGRGDCAVVFPTPVGVFLARLIEKTLVVGLPHARGGVSGYNMKTGRVCMSSPRPWGCF